MKITSSDKYIDRFPKTTQKLLIKIRTTIRKAAPDAKESIKYGIISYVLNGNLVHFGGFKKHIGFYPAPSGIKVFEKELSIYKTSKGAIQFPLDKPLPLKLISKIVKFRVKENLVGTMPKQKKNFKTSSKEGFLSLPSAPAVRALKNEGITTIKKLSKFTKKEILNLHGIGKATIPILMIELEKNNLSFRKEK